NYFSSLILVLGVFFGSAFWWLLLTSGVSIFRGKFSDRYLVWVNRISGLIILAFGLVSLFIVGF
ncbi:MAG TPA: LysE family translocator, partial [Kamptonema sp.]|nr:LysE family translocator [Kamptonema sp.]